LLEERKVGNIDSSRRLNKIHGDDFCLDSVSDFETEIIEEKEDLIKTEI